MGAQRTQRITKYTKSSFECLVYFDALCAPKNFLSLSALFLQQLDLLLPVFTGGFVYCSACIKVEVETELINAKETPLSVSQTFRLFSGAYVICYQGIQ